jgi:hypothetical protein
MNEMTKRILSLLLIVALFCGLCACGKQQENTQKPSSPGNILPGILDNNKNETKEFVKLKPIKGLKNTFIGVTDSTCVRKQGEFPVKPKDGAGVTEKENKYYKSLLCQAIIDMDTKILNEILITNDLVLLHSIYNNSNYKELYKNTIGKAIYLPDSEVFVIKDVEWIFYKWYSDIYEKGGPVPVNIGSLTISDINEIYNKYYDAAPYKIVETSSLTFKLHRGNIKYDANKMITSLLGASCDLKYLTPSSKGYGNFVLGGNYHDFVGKSINPDNIYKKGYDLWKTVYRFNVDEMINIIDHDDSVITDNEWDEEYDMAIYNQYYKNTEYKNQIKEWVKDNYEIYRGVDDIAIFIDIHVKYDSPYQGFTKTEQTFLEKLDIVDSMKCNATDQWSAFRLAVEDMFSNGLL